MADNNLNEPVAVKATRIDATLLPPGFSQPYQLYVIQQGTDFGAVTNKANEAGSGAYEAQVKNEEQDLVLADHENRISGLRIEVDDHEVRITTNTSNIALLEIRVTDVEGSITSINAEISAIDTRLDTNETNIADLQTNKANITDSLLKSGNLSGLASATVSRTNLGLGDSATKNIGTTSGSVAAGDDTRLTTVNGKSGGSISSDISVVGRVSSHGISCRNGVSGTTSPNAFNIYWNGSSAELWIDNLKLGTINVTP